MEINEFINEVANCFYCGSSGAMHKIGDRKFICCSCHAGAGEALKYKDSSAGDSHAYAENPATEPEALEILKSFDIQPGPYRKFTAAQRIAAIHIAAKCLEMSIEKEIVHMKTFKVVTSEGTVIVKAHSFATDPEGFLRLFDIGTGVETFRDGEGKLKQRITEKQMMTITVFAPGMWVYIIDQNL